MTRAVVLLVGSCVFVLPDDIAVVVIDRKTPRQTYLGMSAHALPVHVKRRGVLQQERRLVLQSLEVRNAWA